MTSEAIVLAGGLGTRLRSVITDLPKPMAPVCGKPFLWYLLKSLETAGIKKAVLAVGYKYEVIREYFGHQFGTLTLEYAVENEPLGTGGAIVNALKYASETEIFLINGDTFFAVQLSELWNFHLKYQADISFSLKPMQHFNRYGTVELDKTHRIKAFNEKKQCENGIINGGVYIMKSDLFNCYKLPQKFSLETDILEKHIHQLRLFGYHSDNYFIDIGIPEDYDKAQEDFLKMKF